MAASIGGLERRFISAAAVYLAICSLLQPSVAKSFVVGGPAGWTNLETPGQGGTPNYAAWASSQNFIVGDSLVFKFPPGSHNVWSLPSLTAYKNCDFSQGTQLDGGNSGSYTWQATHAGVFYFSCDKGVEGVGTHCNYNQKLAITVSETATNPTSGPLPGFPSSPPHPSPPATSVSPPPKAVTTPPPAKAPARAPKLAPKFAPKTAPTPGSHAPQAPSKPPVSAPSKPPAPAPKKGPKLAPTKNPPAPSPSLVPASAPVPAPSPSLSPVPGPAVASVPAPSALNPLNPGQPEVPGGGPAASPSPDAGLMLQAAQAWPASCVLSFALFALLW